MGLLSIFSKELMGTIFGTPHIENRVKGSLFVPYAPYHFPKYPDKFREKLQQNQRWYFTAPYIQEKWLGVNFPAIIIHTVLVNNYNFSTYFLSFVYWLWWRVFPYWIQLQAHRTFGYRGSSTIKYFQFYLYMVNCRSVLVEHPSCIVQCHHNYFERIA